MVAVGDVAKGLPKGVESVRSVSGEERDIQTEICL